MSRRLFLLVAVSAGVVVAFAGVVSAGVAPLSLVSGPSPFAACTIGGPGTINVNDEVEPFLAVDPTAPGHMIGVFQQDRWDNGGAHGIVAAVTNDGGATWAETWAHFGLCSGGGDFERASDPWVTFAPNGDAYQSTLTLNGTDSTTGELVSKLAHDFDVFRGKVRRIRWGDEAYRSNQECIAEDRNEHKARP